MIEHFINKKEVAKLDLLYLIISSKEKVFVKEVMNHLKISKNSAFRYLEELSQDISVISKNIKLSVTKRGNYYLKGDTRNDYFILLQIRAYYMSKSSIVLIFKGVIQTDYSVEKLAQSLYFTPSSIYNKIAEINKIADLFNCSINISQPERFKGNEFGIRAFTFIMLLYSNRTTSANPFSSKVPDAFLDLDNIKENLITRKHLSLSQELRLKLLQGITLYRINNRQKFIEFNDNFHADAQFFYEDDFILPTHIDSKFDSEIKSESNVFCFLVRALIFDIDTFKKKTEIVSQYESSNLTLAQEIHFIMSSFSEHASFTYTNKSFVESYYLLLIISIFVKHINIDFTDFYEFKSDLSNYQENIETNFSDNENMIKEFLAKEPFKTQFSHLSEQLKMQLSHILYFIYDMNHPPDKIKIYVQFSKNMYTASTLISSLMTTFSQQSIEITHNPNIADLIISDTFEGDHFKAERFYFENLYDYSQWKQLLQYVTDLIYRKTFFKDIS